LDSALKAQKGHMMEELRRRLKNKVSRLEAIQQLLEFPRRLVLEFVRGALDNINDRLEVWEAYEKLKDKVHQVDFS